MPASERRGAILRQRLRVTYFIVANTAILLLLIQFATHGTILFYEQTLPELMAPGLTEAVKRNYAHMTPQDRDELLRASRKVRYRYAPMIGFVLKETTSRFVNIDVYGIRANGNTPQDITSMERRIWFLGGSTTYGEGIADHETIPAQLERVMGQPVVNLGVSGYSSMQENLLLNQYLRIGYRPSLAIFLDGINESCLFSLYEHEMDVLFNRAQDGYRWDAGGPVAYAYGRVSRWLKRELFGRAAASEDALTCDDQGKRNPLRTIVARTLAERAALCRLYDIECRTLVQPFAGVHGRNDDTVFLASHDARKLLELFAHLETTWRAAGAIFITDALDHFDRHAFIDEVHYSADASRLIAETIAARIVRPGERSPP